MKKKVRFMEVTFEGIQIKQNEIHKFRGSMAELAPENEYMHNHVAGQEQVIYRYPLVQYKRKKGCPFLLVFGEAIPSVYQAIMNTEEIRIEERVEKGFDINIRLCEKTIGDGAPETEYKFLSPWLCLKQENYEKYILLSDEEKQDFLENLLIGNILSLCSGFDVFFEDKLKVELHVKEINTLYKGVKMIAFTGGFKANCYLPSMCGIGKGVSRGMGTIVKSERGGVGEGGE